MENTGLVISGVSMVQLEVDAERVQTLLISLLVRTELSAKLLNSVEQIF